MRRHPCPPSPRRDAFEGLGRLQFRWSLKGRLWPTSRSGTVSAEAISREPPVRRRPSNAISEWRRSSFKGTWANSPFGWTGEKSLRSGCCSPASERSSRPFARLSRQLRKRHDSRLGHRMRQALSARRRDAPAVPHRRQSSWFAPPPGAPPPRPSARRTQDLVMGAGTPAGSRPRGKILPGRDGGGLGKLAGGRVDSEDEG